MTASARANPNKYYIGIDANVEPLKKPSMKATRKPAKGGLSNALFVQAAVEDLPDELQGIADEIHINFPWGSLLRAVASADQDVINGIRRIAKTGCRLEIVIGLDIDRDRSEIERLGLPMLDEVYSRGVFAERYSAAGFEMIEFHQLERGAWSQLETSWARKLSPNDNRRVTRLIFRAV